MVLKYMFVIYDYFKKIKKYIKRRKMMCDLEHFCDIEKFINK
jgi:hypothetical protein